MLYHYTGWHKGKDGKWRFEIDDSKMKISKDISNYMRLGDPLKHDELFAAYPNIIVMPNGAVFRFASEKNNDATQEPLRGVPNVGSLAKATSVASINNILRSRDDVKKYSARYQQNASAAQLLREENADMHTDVAGLQELIALQRKQNGARLRRESLAEVVAYLMKTTGNGCGLSR